MSWRRAADSRSFTNHSGLPMLRQSPRRTPSLSVSGPGCTCRAPPQPPPARRPSRYRSSPPCASVPRFPGRPRPGWPDSGSSEYRRPGSPSAFPKSDADDAPCPARGGHGDVEEQDMHFSTSESSPRFHGIDSETVTICPWDATHPATPWPMGITAEFSASGRPVKTRTFIVSPPGETMKRTQPAAPPWTGACSGRS